MMKTFILTISVLILLLAGCTNVEETNLRSELNTYSQALNILSNEIEEAQSVEIYKHWNNNILIEIKRTNNNENEIDSKFYLVDLKNSKSKEILWETEGYLETVAYDNNHIIFTYNGGNKITGANVFPYQKIYTISEGTLENKIMYKELGYRGVLGWYVNSADLDTISIDDKELQIQFKANDKTLIAGGELLPRIVTGNTEDKFYIDLWNLTITAEFMTMLEDLTKSPFIDHVETRVYTDALNIDHVVILFRLNSITEYNSDTPMIDGKRKLLINFK